MAFADDILIIADDEKEAKKLIQAMASLSEAGLHLNKEKTTFMTDKSNLNRIEEIEGGRGLTSSNIWDSKSLATEVNC